MCYHKAVPQKAKLEEFLLQKAIVVPDYAGYYHVNGFDHPQIPVLTMEQPDQLQLMMWGLVPEFARDRREAQQWAQRMLNITSEKHNSTYRTYFASRRCLVFVEGFYEWQWLDTKGKEKQPWFIHQPQGRPFALGAIYNLWCDHETGEVFATYGVVTTPANELMASIHNSRKRMPLILEEKDWDAWLDPHNIRYADLLQPCAEHLLQAHSVSRNISRRGYDTNVPETQKRQAGCSSG